MNKGGMAERPEIGKTDETIDKADQDKTIDRRL